MFCFLNVANKFLLFFQKVLTCFYKVFENGDFANAINFSFPSLMAAMLVSAMLSKLLLGWIVLIELSTTFTFLVMHVLLELLLAMVLWLFALT